MAITVDTTYSKVHQANLWNVGYVSLILIALGLIYYIVHVIDLMKEKQAKHKLETFEFTK
jgi:hypothetical protein